MTGRNRQSMQGMKLKGDARQSSDQPDTAMSMRDVSAHDASQKLAGNVPSLEVFGWKGRGTWAVVALVVVVLAFFVAKVLLK